MARYARHAKHSLAVSAWLALVTATVFCAVDAAAADLSAAKLFDKALEHSGSRVIHSGSAVIEEDTTGADQQVTHLRYRMAFDGDDISGASLREYLQGGKHTGAQLCGSSESGETVGVQSNVDPASGRLGILVSNQRWAFPTFRHFGRLAGRADTGPESAMNSLARLTGSIRLAGRETLEGAELQIVEIDHVDGSKRKVWIDPDRGYICPRNELYEGKRLVSKTESTGYFLEPKSGLYFPENHTDTTWDKQSGRQLAQWKYHVDPQSLVLNDVAAEEFSIVAPPSTIIGDLRSGGRTWQATAEARLRVGADGLDLAKVEGLKAVSGPSAPRALNAFFPSASVRWPKRSSPRWRSS